MTIGFVREEEDTDKTIITERMLTQKMRLTPLTLSVACDLVTKLNKIESEKEQVLLIHKYI